jgi:preprotein translocase subunit SecB
MSEQNEQEQQFSLQKLFLKDVSFESPMTPDIFTQQWRPQIKLDLNISNNKLQGDNFEVILKLTLTAAVEEKTALLIEIQQAGIFLIKGLDDETLRQVLSIGCANILFPYARETIDSLALKGGFPPFQLQPINFEAMYVQQMQQQQAAQANH